MNKRPPVAQRCFQSPVIEHVILDVQSRIRDAKIAELFANCFPNTLDTTVNIETDADGRVDAFIVTGDITAMWLRDSTNQVWPYLRFVNDDVNLKRLFQGVINRQVDSVLIDPYANAFNRIPIAGDWMSDMTLMTPHLHERKYELDSLCAVIRLSCAYYEASRDASCFDERWNNAMRKIVATIRHEQAGSEENGKGSYRFQRVSPSPTETLAGNGYGQPANRCGLSKSPFRPSDDAALLPFLIPANAMAVACLKQLAVLWSDICHQPKDAADAALLAAEIQEGIQTHAVVTHPKFGEIYAYEVDGFGSHYCMDDANIPSLLSLPYLGYCRADDPLYVRTRQFILSSSNPYYAMGQAGNGVGSPHTGRGTIWPMAIVMQALTIQSEEETRQCLRQLVETDAGTGFMHESYWKNDASCYTRDWFAWANSMFGELILTVDSRYPGLLQRI